MQTFYYSGFIAGKRHTGNLEEESLQAARTRLRNQGCIVTELRPVKADATGVPSNENEEISSFERLGSRILITKGQWELSMRQLASLLQAGVPILTAFSAVARQADPLLARVYGRVSTKLRQGHSMQQCLSEEAPSLGRVALGLIGVGEANGALDEMLDYAADLMEQARKVKGQIVQAFAYPLIVILGAMGVSYYMVSVVFPQIMTFIQKQGRNTVLPLPTRVLIRVNDFLEVWGLYLFACPFIIAIAFFLARKVHDIGKKLDYGVLHIPLLGKAFRDHANTMWCRTLAALLHSGVDIIAALELVESTMGNLHYAVQFKRMREIVRQGRSLTDGIKETNIHRLCPMALTMVSVSEESGGLDTSLFHVARYCEERLSRRVALLSKLVEPAIFVVVGGMVGFVYFAFFMAMLAVTKSAH